MRIVSRKTIKTTLLAFLSVFLLLSSSCSFLNLDQTSSVTFTMNTSREAFSDSDGVYMDIELKGGYNDSQTIAVSSGNQFTVTFDGVPIGVNVYVQAQVYKNYKGLKSILYAGKSESKSIADSDNNFSIKMESVYNNIATAAYSCLIAKPLFYKATAPGDLLNNNKLDFNSGSSSFCWAYDKLNEYQKIKITLKQLAGSSPDNDISISFLNTQTSFSSSSQSYTVSTNSSSCELQIPEDTVYDAITIMHSAVAADDFICAIESIELQTIGSFNLVDITLPSSPAFEVKVTQGTTESGATEIGTSGVVSINSSMKIFFAVVNPEPHASTKYTWKKNTVEVKSGFGSDNSKFSITMSELTSGEINDITLFVDDDTFHESWTIQIKRIES